MNSHEVKAKIAQIARDAGFSAVGFAGAATLPAHRDDLAAFVAQGRHGDMAWMEETLARRQTPRAMWGDAKTAIVLGMNYGPQDDPMAGAEDGERGRVSVYARGKDYHDLIKKRLKRVARAMVATWGGDVKVFTDTAPLMEKPLAQLAGIGWQGKHTNLVSRQFGSWLFLGEILTTLDLVPDEPTPDMCGSCTRCIDVCPTQAITAPYEIDARRCISYLTIETKGDIGQELASKMGNHLFGCDDCLAVCPWNKFATPGEEDAFLPRPQTDLPKLADMVALDDAAFRERFAGTPVKRAGRDRMVRNAVVALGNSTGPAARTILEQCRDDSSDLVRRAVEQAVK